MTGWIQSAGGPLLCAGPSAASGWRGIYGCSTPDRLSDYERACDVTAYVSVLRSGEDSVIVFGDEPLQSALVEQLDAVLVFRWVSCRSIADAERAIGQAPATLPEIESPTLFHAHEPGLVLFDAALCLNEAKDVQRARLTVGSYAISTERYAVPDQFEFLIHRFVRIRPS